MSEARTPLEALIAKWRQQAGSSCGSAYDYGLRACADELEAALAAVPPAPSPLNEALLREHLTCRNGAPHYCPNCDNTINADRILAAVRTSAVPPAEPAPREKLENFIAAVQQMEHVVTGGAPAPAEGPQPAEKHRLCRQRADDAYAALKVAESRLREVEAERDEQRGAYFSARDGAAKANADNAALRQQLAELEHAYDGRDLEAETYLSRAEEAEAAVKALQQRVERLTEAAETVISEMNANLGPSWPPNFQSGERVAAWRKILRAALAAETGDGK